MIPEVGIHIGTQACACAHTWQWGGAGAFPQVPMATVQSVIPGHTDLAVYILL